MKQRQKKKIIFSLLIFSIALFLIFLAIEISNLNKIAHGLKIAGIKVGGLKTEQAENILREKFSEWENSSLIFIYENKQFAAKPSELGISLNFAKTLDAAYNFGREKNIFLGISRQIRTLIPFAGKNISPDFSFNEEKFNHFAQIEFIGLEDPAINASLLFDNDSRNWEKTPSKQGKIFSRAKIKKELKKRIDNLDYSTIPLILIDDYPEVEENETETAKEQAEQVLKNSPYAIKYNGKTWEIDRETLLDWIIFIPVDENRSSFPLEKDNSTSPSPDKGNSSSLPPLDKDNSASSPPLDKGGIKGGSNKILGLSFSQEKIKNILTEIAPSINQEPINAELTIKDNKVTAFSLSQDGVHLDIDKSAEKITNEIINIYSLSKVASLPPLDKDNSSLPLLDKEGIKGRFIELIVSRSAPQITTENIDTLGLTSLLGTGASNFAGSPNNRIHNIKIGAAKFDGILLKPSEEFSFAKIVGEIGAKQGYLPELVIKKNKTVPEYGGGICQVSTTIFRAAINSGLKITERYPHAFPVKYYNPQGFDSTVYPPHPDLRFINDTPNNILIQAKISGTKITFEFYGTADSREIKIKGPTTLSAGEDGSMKTILYQEIWRDGKMERQDKFFSNYKSPDLYPVERNPLE